MDAGRQAAGTRSDTKTRKQEMVQVVCAGGLYAIGAKTQLATGSAGTAAGVANARSRGKDLDPRLNANNARAEVAHTLTSAELDWKNACASPC